MRNIRRRRISAGAIGLVVLAWLLFPLTGSALADLSSTSLTGDDPVGTVAGTVEEPVGTVGVVEDPAGTVEGVVEDPVGTVEGTVDGILNPTSPPDPGGGPSPTDPSPESEPTPTDPSPESDPTPTDPVQDSIPASEGPINATDTSGVPTAPVPGFEQVLSTAAVNAPVDSSPYGSYRPAATRFVPLSSDGATSYKPTYGQRSTLAVLKVLEGKKASPRVVAKILAPFPVAGPANYSDDWAAPRYQPEFHLHEGADIFAKRGTPVIAASKGVVSKLVERSAVGGTSLRLSAPDGTFFYYAHLDRFAPRLVEGMSVSEGDVLGFVGATGNAEGGQPHLHFEIHPNGGVAVPPVPYLDRWLAEALHAARALKAQSTGLRQLVNVPVRAAAIASRAIGNSLSSAQQVVSPSDLATWLVMLSIPAGLWLRKRRRRGRPSLLGASWLEAGLPFASNPTRPG